MFSLMLGLDLGNIIIHFCTILSLAAQNINSGTFRGLITVIPVVRLILWDPFAAALQMVQELKPQLVNLRRQQRELLMKSNDYKNDCTNNILIYRLDSLASSMKSSTDPTSDLGRLYVYRVIGLPEEWRLVLCFKPNEVLEFLGHG
ncbi:hypothetical protein DKX38_006830 [Salix brachista]|uniref:Uncharacterized protein n=1 Tax=Salix brachista TaxID=2182728 RepID=A0A5N5MP28_9ROSI|nr:hypothetical protein DKX38_006830 [Salix brachista]